MDNASKLVRPTEAVPPRDQSADAGVVDLSAYYSHGLDDEIHHKPGNTLHQLPKGLQKLGGVTFDLRGLVQLKGARSLEITGLEYPEAVLGIPVRARGNALHFIHASAWESEPGTTIGEYRFKLASGRTTSVPIVFKRNIMDWWDNPTDPADRLDGDTRIVWTGTNTRTTERGYGTRLFIHSVANPHPEDRIEAMDFVSRIEIAAPFLLAVTIA